MAEMILQVPCHFRSLPKLSRINILTKIRDLPITSQGGETNIVIALIFIKPRIKVPCCSRRDSRRSIKIKTKQFSNMEI